MRREFLEGLAALADVDPRVVLLTADLGFGSIEVFADRHPDRFINVGVAEQAMVGIATGLAEGGFVPYCYSIAAFSVARTFEFLRNGPIAHGLPVRLIGVGPGMDYSFDGLTHFALEDVGLMLSQSPAVIVAPRDSLSALEYGAKGSEHQGLVYYRLARSGPAVDARAATDGFLADCLVLGLGDACTTARVITDRLMDMHGISAQCVAIEELSQDHVNRLAAGIADSSASTVVTVESHYSTGGFGSAISDALVRTRWKGDLVKWGIERRPTTSLGSYSHMVQTFCPSIADTCGAVVVSRR